MASSQSPTLRAHICRRGVLRQRRFTRKGNFVVLPVVKCLGGEGDFPKIASIETLYNYCCKRNPSTSKKKKMFISSIVIVIVFVMVIFMSLHSAPEHMLDHSDFKPCMYTLLPHTDAKQK